MSEQAGGRSSAGTCVAVMLLMTFLGSSANATEPDRSSSRIENHTVRIAGMQFAPAELVVKRGSRIVWINEDLFPHTVTADESFDSAAIAAGTSWTYMAIQPGTYAYVCTLHPTMKGRLIVQ